MDYPEANDIKILVEARFRVSENFASDKGNAHVRWDGITTNVTSGVWAD